MVKGSEMNLLFFFGVLIPALITVALFVVFCYCWYKMRIRSQILYKKHDPHKIEKLKELGKNYEPPHPPPPPFKSSLLLFPDSHNNNNKSLNNDNYEEQPEPTEGFDNPAMYRTNPDSGFSDLNKIQCNVDHIKNSTVQRHDNNLCRPNSQASDDSDDSGFRSSRSGQYIHSASNSTGNAQDSSGVGVHSLHVKDSVPLFHPIKIHPNETGRPPMVSYVNRSSSKHKGHRQRLPLPSSQQCSSHSESHNNSVSINSMNTPQHSVPSSVPRGSYGVGGGHIRDPQCNRMDISLVSKSVNDVHGGRLHSVDSHTSPLTYAGNYGVKSCMDICNHRNNYLPNGLYNIDGQLSSIGYASDMNSLSDMSSLGYLRNLPNVQANFSLPVSPQLPVSNRVPVNSYIPGYNISENSHLRPIKPEPGVYNVSDAMSFGLDPARNITFTQALVHKPHIEELSDPKLYSVV